MYFKVKTSEEVFDLLKGFESVGEELIDLENGLGRVLSREIISSEDLPGFERSTMDGYAIKAKDVFGATESIPALLEVSGEVLMGETPKVTVEPGKAVKISTGGMLPQGADGVVMLEYCHPLDDVNIEVSRSISPLENVINRDDDFKKGQTVFKKGHVLRPQDLGLLAGLGISELTVYKRPKVAIISTGDEIVDINSKPGPGQVRDINSYTLGAFCRQEGAIPSILGLCEDSFERLRELVAIGLDKSDSLWISGGSSVGVRDLTLKVFESFDDMELLAHGISISPGKPTIIARIGKKAIFGLPGHTTSAMVVAEVFLKPFIAWISGEVISESAVHQYINAEMGQNVESANGRDDYIRIRLKEKEDRLIAEPVFGKSGLISTLVDAHGFVKIDRNTEGVYEGQEVKVMLLNPHKGNF